MGTDIHMYSEVRDGDAWKPSRPLMADSSQDNVIYFMEAVYKDRDYSLFDLLSGARGVSDVTPLFPVLEDLPADVSAEVARVYAENDVNYHSIGMATLSQLRAQDYSSINEPVSWQQTLDDLAALGDEDDVRVVWWFDN